MEEIKKMLFNCKIEWSLYVGGVCRDDTRVTTAELPCGRTVKGRRIITFQAL